MEKDSDNPRVSLPTAVAAALLIILAAVSFLAVAVYFFDQNGKIAQAAQKIIPFPAAIISFKKTVAVKELREDLEAVRKFYENQDFSQIDWRVDFSTPQGQKRLKVREKQIFNKLIEDRAIELLARGKGIFISSQFVDQNLQRKLEEYGQSSGVEEKLERLYGWSMDDFKNKVVKPSLYKEELEKKVLEEKSEIFSQDARNKIKEADNFLKEGGSFEEAVEKYSEGQSRNQKGELGWFTRDQLIEEVREAAFQLEKNRRSEIIESEIGFHIIEVGDKKEQDGEELVKIRQIFTQKTTFADWLGEEMKKMRILVLLRDYYWNNDKALVEFRDAELTNFERDLMENLEKSGLIMP